MKSKVIAIFFLCILANIFLVAAIKESYPKVDDVLYQLIRADDFNKFILEHPVYIWDVRGSQIKVELDLSKSNTNLTPNNFVMPSDSGTVDARYQNLMDLESHPKIVEAHVEINKLLELADNPDIERIKLLNQGFIDDINNQKQNKSIEDAKILQQKNFTSDFSITKENQTKNVQEHVQPSRKRPGFGFFRRMLNWFKHLFS